MQRCELDHPTPQAEQNTKSLEPLRMPRAPALTPRVKRCTTQDTPKYPVGNGRARQCSRRSRG
eukprot:14767133-Alexandrium_andersonii.AAC.1